MGTELHSIIASMTLEEKAALCTGASAWSTLDKDPILREWMAYPRGRAAFGSWYQWIEEESLETFGGGDSGTGIDVMAMMGAMPLVSALMWHQAGLPQHREDLVAGLLASVHDQAA